MKKSPSVNCFDKQKFLLRSLGIVTQTPVSLSYVGSISTQVHEDGRGLMDLSPIIDPTAWEDDCHTLCHGHCTTHWCRKHTQRVLKFQSIIVQSLHKNPMSRHLSKRELKNPICNQASISCGSNPQPLCLTLPLAWCFGCRWASCCLLAQRLLPGNLVGTNI